MDSNSIVAIIGSGFTFIGGIAAGAFVAKSAKGRQQAEVLVAEEKEQTARLAVKGEAAINAKKLEAEITASLLKYTDERIDRLELALEKERERGAKRIAMLEAHVSELTATVDELKDMVADRDAIIADLKKNDGYTKVSLYD